MIPDRIRTKRSKSRVGTAIVGKIPTKPVDYIFKVPNTKKGRQFIEQLESYMLPQYSIRIRGGALDKEKYKTDPTTVTCEGKKVSPHVYYQFGVPVRLSKTLRIYVHANNDHGKRGTPVGFGLVEELMRKRKVACDYYQKLQRAIENPDLWTYGKLEERLKDAQRRNEELSQRLSKFDILERAMQILKTL